MEKKEDDGMEGYSDRIRIATTEDGFRRLAEEVKETAHGGKVLLFAKEDRAGKEAATALTTAGVPVIKQSLEEGGVSIDLLLSKEYPESILAVVGVGGAAEMQAAKSVRIGRVLPRILFPTDLSALNALDERSFFSTKGDVLTFTTEGHAVLLDKKMLTSGVREGVGWVLARLIEIADGGYQGLIEEGKSPTDALTLFREGCALLQGVREEDAAERLMQTALLLQDRIREKALTLSDSAHILSFLIEKRVGGSAVSYLFAAAYSLLCLYARYLGDLPLEHAVPPDPVKNEEKLRDLSGIGSLTFSEMPLYADLYAERFRLTAEYREDFSECFSDSFLPLSALCRVYRRKGGGKEGVAPSANELLALLSLTGELVSGYPLIKHIKMSGILEPLLACC